jgi:antitoxin HicB
MLRYSVRLSRDTNGSVLVDVPAIPEAHTFGEDREEAMARAVDAIETALGMYVDDRREIPASDAKARTPFVTLPVLTETKLALYSAMRAQRIGKAELSRRLNCHLPQVDRLLDLDHASRLDQLEAAFRVLGKRLTIEIREAA